MYQDRRNFITTIGTLGAATLLYPTGLLADTLPASVEVIFKAGFAARLREWFYLYNADASAQGDLRLIKLLDRGSDAQMEQFSLILQSRKGASPMPSGYYEVSGEPFALHIEHTDDNKGKQLYRAEFALLL